MAKVETERDSAAFQISSLQGDLDRVKRELEKRVRKEERLLDECRLLDEYETEVARKSFHMVHKTWERAVDYIMLNPNADWVGFYEEFIRLDKLKGEEEQVTQDEVVEKVADDVGSPLDPLNFETGETSGAK